MIYRVKNMELAQVIAVQQKGRTIGGQVAHPSEKLDLRSDLSRQGGPQAHAVVLGRTHAPARLREDAPLAPTRPPHPCAVALAPPTGRLGTPACASTRPPPATVGRAGRSTPQTSDHASSMSRRRNCCDR